MDEWGLLYTSAVVLLHIGAVVVLAVVLIGNILELVVVRELAFDTPSAGLLLVEQAYSHWYVCMYSSFG